jgi:hypothetical protein
LLLSTMLIFHHDNNHRISVHAFSTSSNFIVVSSNLKSTLKSKSSSSSLSLSFSSSSPSPKEQQQQQKRPTISASSIFLDIGVNNEPIGRLIFHLSSMPVPPDDDSTDDDDDKATTTTRYYHPLPIHTENFIQLCKGSYRGIDPRCHYVGCTFDFNPTTIEEPSLSLSSSSSSFNSGRYKWSHSSLGRQRNVLNGGKPIKDAISTSQCTHTCFGGQYYGWKYSEDKERQQSENDNDDDDDDDDPNVMLCVPVSGPYYGTTKFSIVRVGESPVEWNERLLLNSGVIGKMDHRSSYDVLLRMARQTSGPPTILDAGVL